MTKSSLIFVSVMLLNSSCAHLQDVNRFRDAAQLICDGIAESEDYADDVETIKAALDNKDYVAALLLAKALYVEVYNSGDKEKLDEIVALVTSIASIVKKEQQ